MSVAAARRGRSVKCPNCNADVIVGGGKAGQKVKCPKCTVPLPVNLDEPPPATPTAEQQLAAALERIERLEARIVVIEHKQEQALAAIPPTVLEGEAHPAVSKLKWIRSPETTSAEKTVFIPDAVHEQALVHNLRVLAGSEIIIRSATGNFQARELAERFKQLFTEAEWKVNGVDDFPVPSGAHGLALAAGSLPPTRNATRTFLALTAAGFELESRLDMTLHSDETMLIVA